MSADVVCQNVELSGTTLAVIVLRLKVCLQNRMHVMINSNRYGNFNNSGHFTENQFNKESSRTQILNVNRLSNHPYILVLLKLGRR